VNIAVVGSRDWPNSGIVKEKLTLFVDHLVPFNEPITIVSGGARGVDTWAEEWARDHGHETLIFKPDWNRYGNSAGFRRNMQIVDAADLVIAFQWRESRGTQHSIDLAKQAKKPLRVVTGG
jgi:hypothetical protein